MIRPPDYIGPEAETWEIPPHEDYPLTVTAWLIYAPNQAAGWEYYTLGLLSLEDKEGVPEAHRWFPDAQWEVNLVALNPEAGHDPDAPEHWAHLIPPNLVYQMGSNVPEDTARELTKRIMAAVAHGALRAEPLYPWGTGPETGQIIGAVDRLLGALITGRDLPPSEIMFMDAIPPGP